MRCSCNYLFFHISYGILFATAIIYTPVLVKQSMLGKIQRRYVRTLKVASSVLRVWQRRQLQFLVVSRVLRHQAVDSRCRCAPHPPPPRGLIPLDYEGEKRACVQSFSFLAFLCFPWLSLLSVHRPRGQKEVADVEEEAGWCGMGTFAWTICLRIKIGGQGRRGPVSSQVEI